MIKKLWDRMFTREVLTYLLFGVLTTVVNYVVFWLTLRLGGEEMVLVANALAFVASVIFAYVTNKIFVFQSKSWTWNVLKKEVATFVGARLLSFGLEELGLLLCTHVWKVGRWALFGINGILVAKVVLSFLVVILNYVISKFLVFQTKEKK